MRLIVLFTLLIISFNSQAWTSIAFGKQTSYVYTHIGAFSKADAERSALEGCAKNDNDCVINVSATGKDTLIALVRYDNGIYTASGTDLNEVENRALNNCRKEYNSCYLQKVYWDGVGYFGGAATINGEVFFDSLYSSDDLDDAKQHALDKCKSKSSTPDLCEAKYYNNSIYIAHAKSNNKEEGYIGFSNGTTKEMAEQNALSYCEENGKRKCSIYLSYRSAYTSPVPQNIAKRIAQLDKAYTNKQAAKEKLPAKQVIAKNTSVNRTSCENSCYNGSCIRTFPDGTKEKWQAPRVFNPLTNNWEFDTTTNACG